MDKFKVGDYIKLLNGKIAIVNQMDRTYLYYTLLQTDDLNPGIRRSGFKDLSYAYHNTVKLQDEELTLVELLYG